MSSAGTGRGHGPAALGPRVSVQDASSSHRSGRLVRALPAAGTTLPVRPAAHSQRAAPPSNARPASLVPRARCPAQPSEGPAQTGPRAGANPGGLRSPGESCPRKPDRPALQGAVR